MIALDDEEMAAITDAARPLPPKVPLVRKITGATDIAAVMANDEVEWKPVL